LRRSANLRGYGQKDPLNEYKSEAYVFFEELMANVRTEICNSVFRSATSAEAFNNMLARLSESVKVTGPGTGQPQPGALAAAAQPQPAASVAAPKQVELPKVESIRRELPKLRGNETVTARKGVETQQVKFKKAESMILNDGWQLVQK